VPSELRHPRLEGDLVLVEDFSKIMARVFPFSGKAFFRAPPFNLIADAMTSSRSSWRSRMG